MDERIYLINDFGQYELWTQDLAGEEAAQEAKKETVSQLTAVVDHIAEVAAHAGAVLPDKPWLPPLGTRLVTPGVDAEPGIPLGLLDVPSRQAQDVYRFRLEDAGHTAIYGSPGYGASTLLQTMVMNLARQGTPEQVHFLLLDFGNNGLLPLARLPHVADIVTLEEEEKLQKAMERIAAELADRKRRLRAVGVATLAQYTAKTGESLPTVLTVLDGYDALAQDKRKDGIDSQLIQILREGAALGVYLVLTANRANSLRMNMSSNIPTSIGLYLNDEGEVATLFGRERVPQSEILGRGQLHLDAPTAIQFFLPCEGDDDAAVLESLEKEIAAIGERWTGGRPERIPMVPEKLTADAFQEFAPAGSSRNTLFLGLNKGSAEPEWFELFHGETLGIFPENGKQAAEVHPFLMRNLVAASAEADLVVIDAHDALHHFLGSEASLFVGKAMLKSHSDAVKRAVVDLAERGTRAHQCLVINGMTDVIDKLALPKGELSELLGVGSDQAQVIVMDHMTRLNSNFGLAGSLKENLGQILFGGDLSTQRFVENLSFAAKKQAYGKNVLHSARDGELTEIVVPARRGSEG